MADAAKVALSLLGAVLLIWLCADLLARADPTNANIAFAVVFLALLAYALQRAAGRPN